ncbi:hypothetical protein OBBRIDRAFT_830269 [Obba rivulosa]|uniref:Uncharacterized protein n=1 Tax=Obba rivulosa TaxID=1052685 RepID=A0A8E2DVP2_9APHY|nr:hypothetical protein OBBRIDRAFT_830269 [Obba rivulosa]
MALFNSKRNDPIRGTPERVSQSREANPAAYKAHPREDPSDLDKPHRSQSLSPSSISSNARAASSAPRLQTLDSRTHNKQPRSPTHDDARAHLQSALADLRGARAVAERVMLTEPQSLPTGSSSPLASAYSLNVAIPSTGSLLSSSSGSGSGSLSDTSTPHPRRRPSHDALASHAHTHSQPLSKSHLHPHAHSVHSQHPKLPAMTVTAPGSRKSSAASLDRDALSRLDMKRLLSKPAAHSTGAASDSERAPPPPALQPRRHPSHLDLGRSYLTVEKQRSKDRPSTATGVEGSPDLSSNFTPSGAGSPRELQHFPPPKARNVLRRKSSARSNPATPTASTFRSIAEPMSPPPPRRSPPSTFRSSATTVTGMPRSPITPPDLTPAGKVAHAYMRQEQRRSELEEMSGWNDHVRQFHIGGVASGSRDDVRSMPSDREKGEDAEDGDNGPYYTVVGTSAGHRVAARAAQVDSWTLDGACWSSDERHPPAQPRKSLTRKISGRIRRVVRGSSDIERAPERGREWRPYDGQVLEEERRSGSTSRNVRPATASGMGTVRPSVDGYVDVAQEGLRSPVPSAKNGFPEKESPEGRTLRTSKSVRGNERERDEDASPGSKWWRLVKRISTGGLRDKYSQRSTTPPPVPALPPDLRKAATTPASRMTFEIHKSPAQSEAGNNEGGVLLSRFIQSRASLSGIRPSVQARSPPQSTPTPPKKHSMGSRPSTTTRSSSPVSSEFFHRTHSTRSSASSYGEEVPPMPQTLIAQHILSPDELHRLESNDSVEQSPTPEARRPRKPPPRSQSAPDEQTYSTISENFRSLPLPPRRPSSGPREARAAHPTPSRPPSIPSFSTEEPVNNFSPSPFPLPLSEFGVLPDAPPRPKRSDRRHPKHIDIPAPTDTLPQPALTPRTPRAVPSVTVDVHVSTLPSDTELPSSVRNVSSPSSASTHSSSLSQKRSPLLFREMDSPRHQWTEQEKAQKWEDLLAQSARAGGTLHIGESGLLSDTARLSIFDGPDADL